MMTQLQNLKLGLLVTTLITTGTMVAQADDHHGRTSFGLSITRQHHGTGFGASIQIGRPTQLVQVRPIVPVGPVVGPFGPVGPSRPVIRPVAPRVLPPVVQPVVPRLGFMGHIEFGLGMVVDAVLPGSAAHRFGFEPGDVITRINHFPIVCDNTYQQALIEAVQNHNGFVEIDVLDVRSGQLIQLGGNLNNCRGPVLPRARLYDQHVEHNQHHGFHDQHDHGHNGFARNGSAGLGSATVAKPSYLTKSKSAIVAPAPKSF